MVFGAWGKGSGGSSAGLARESGGQTESAIRELSKAEREMASVLVADLGIQTAYDEHGKERMGVHVHDLQSRLPRPVNGRSPKQTTSLPRE